MNIYISFRSSQKDLSNSVWYVGIRSTVKRYNPLNKKGLLALIFFFHANNFRWDGIFLHYNLHFKSFPTGTWHAKIGLLNEKLWPVEIDHRAIFTRTENVQGCHNPMFPFGDILRVKFLKHYLKTIGTFVFPPFTMYSKDPGMFPSMKNFSLRAFGCGLYFVGVHSYFLYMIRMCCQIGFVLMLRLP